MWKPKIGDHVRHKITNKTSVIEKIFYNSVALCKLDEPYYIKNPNRMLIDCNIHHIENLILVLKS